MGSQKHATLFCDPPPSLAPNYSGDDKTRGNYWVRGACPRFHRPSEAPVITLVMSSLQCAHLLGLNWWRISTIIRRMRVQGSCRVMAVLRWVKIWQKFGFIPDIDSEGHTVQSTKTKNLMTQNKLQKTPLIMNIGLEDVNHKWKNEYIWYA